MPVPALFRYRKRVLLGRSSEGPHQVVKVASRAQRARPVLSIYGSRHAIVELGSARIGPGYGGWRRSSSCCCSFHRRARSRSRWYSGSSGRLCLRARALRVPTCFPASGFELRALAAAAGLIAWHAVASRQAVRIIALATRPIASSFPSRHKKGRRPLPVPSALCRRHHFRQGPARNRTRLYGHTMDSPLRALQGVSRCSPPPLREGGVSQASAEKHSPGTHPQSELVERFRDLTSQHEAD